ncbi:MAG: DUF3488 and transglutaminase-like domain-containing protein [Actinomycetota bacterium]|nr:DUF3488 and transglutaminase-like domain-containing protein [Actinomycetota bacterium]
MRNSNSHELLAQANPIPDVNQLDTEAFSIDDVMDRLEEAVTPVGRRWAMRHGWGRALAAVGTTFALVIAIGAAATLVLRADGSISGSGGTVCLDSQTETRIGSDFYGSPSYNPFIGIQQSLVSNSDEPVFSAHVTGDLPAADMYFRLLTLETYDGNQFYASPPATGSLDDRPWVDPCHQWNGPAIPVTIDVEIDRLRMSWLPAPATPTIWRSTQELGDRVRVRHVDGALSLDGAVSYSGMQYSLDVEIPQVDLNTLVADADGVLTATFATAAANGEIVPNPQPVESFRAAPPDPERHVGLPADDSLRTGDLRSLAGAVTAGAESVFERGLYLEAWFHSNAFRYSVDVEPGLEGNGVAAWLLDSESPIYRTGNAEHYATAMAVLARTLDIPSRVVLGFAPGEPTDGGTVVLRDRDAHAWVELWVPQHGWVAFDPTPRADGDTTPTFELVAEQLGFDLVPYLVP